LRKRGVERCREAVRKLAQGADHYGVRVGGGLFCAGLVVVRISGGWVEGVEDGDEEDAVEDYEQWPPAIQPGFI